MDYSALFHMKSKICLTYFAHDCRFFFLYTNNNFISPSLSLLLWNAWIQTYLYYACPAWYPNLTKYEIIAITRSKSVRFCLKLSNRASIF